ncbi:MAG: transcriptional regulator, ArsR family [Marmoricola sp.]|nr:transcriptional regulator, ArsR family [Marmoricola sp.]
MAELDPLIHAPARLQVLTTLSAVSEAEFATLRNALEVSDSVLSKHISALADAGYVQTRKGVQAGRRTTWIGLTGSGRKALRDHVAALRRMIDLVVD